MKVLNFRDQACLISRFKHPVPWKLSPTAAVRSWRKRLQVDHHAEIGRWSSSGMPKWPHKSGVILTMNPFDRRSQSDWSRRSWICCCTLTDSFELITSTSWMGDPKSFFGNLGNSGGADISCDTVAPVSQAGVASFGTCESRRRLQWSCI
jgi:hypothetical protein